LAPTVITILYPFAKASHQALRERRKQAIMTGQIICILRFMNDNTLVVFDHVWKKFERGERHTSLRDLIPSVAATLLARRSTDTDALRQQEFWAVRDVSFTVDRGRAVGIIGPNGAGKSTTLKLLTKILRPTRGNCAIKGRVGALIEVAAGFHPDLTGRENVYLQGAIMGMARAEVKQKLDAIIDFSGLHEFVDTPVKRYSSGMNARLGFSIAANLNPDVLVIDEVLAVGDMAFQQRCINRMEEFKKDGVAIVFVSHNLQAVASLCDEAVFMAGELKARGRPDEVIRAYVTKSDETTEAANNDTIRITSTNLYNRSDRPVDNAVQPGESLRLRVSFSPTVDARDVTFGFLLYRSTDNLLVYDGHFTNAEIGVPTIRAGEPLEVDFHFKANVTRGHYHITTRIYDNIIQRFRAIVSPPVVFSVDELQTWDGIAHLDVKPALARFDQSRAEACARIS
jgi:lipopolysaccharide transport system ATP-binding protein